MLVYSCDLIDNQCAGYKSGSVYKQEGNGGTGVAECRSWNGNTCTEWCNSSKRCSSSYEDFLQ